VWVIPVNNGLVFILKLPPKLSHPDKSKLPTKLSLLDLNCFKLLNLFVRNVTVFVVPVSG
jgi:hypothetical protein